MATVKLIINKNSLKKYEKTPIYLQYCYTSEKRTLIHTNIFVLPSEWNFEKTEVRRSTENFIKLNDTLKLYKAQIEKIIRLANEKGIKPTPQHVRMEFERFLKADEKGVVTDDNSFFSFLDRFYEESKSRVQKDSVKGYKALFNNLKAFASESSGKTLEKTLSGNFSYATDGSNDRYNNFTDASVEGRDGTNMQIGVQAAINAVEKGVDYSNGAIQWDGTDVLTGTSGSGFNPDKHFRQQKAAFDDRIGITDPSGLSNQFYNNTKNYFKGTSFENKVKPLKVVSSSSTYLWNVTATYGKSIFYKENK